MELSGQLNLHSIGIATRTLEFRAEGIPWTRGLVRGELTFVVTLVILPLPEVPAKG